jgi:putative N6-adenine-specific DNA methylase
VAIVGSDRDAGAIGAALENARRAGVEGDVEFQACAVSDMRVPEGEGGLVATNPPYGVRVGERHQVRNLYAQFGNTVRRRCGGWRLAVFSPDRALTRQIGVDLRPAVQTRNGGIPVAIELGEIPSGAGPASGRVYF